MCTGVYPSTRAHFLTIYYLVLQQKHEIETAEPDVRYVRGPLLNRHTSESSLSPVQGSILLYLFLYLTPCLFIFGAASGQESELLQGLSKLYHLSINSNKRFSVKVKKKKIRKRKYQPTLSGLNLG